MIECVNLKDLRFPLADLRYTARSEFAKQKLLTGKSILRRKSTDINDIDFSIGVDDLYLRVPVFDLVNFNHFRVASYSMNEPITRKLVKVADYFYRLLDSNLFFIIESNVIIHILRIDLPNKPYTIDFRKLSRDYNIMFEGLNEGIFISRCEYHFGSYISKNNLLMDSIRWEVRDE